MFPLKTQKWRIVSGSITVDIAWCIPLYRTISPSVSPYSRVVVYTVYITYTCIYIHTCINIYIHTCIYIYIHSYILYNIYIHISTYSIYICTYVHPIISPLYPHHSLAQSPVLSVKSHSTTFFWIPIETLIVFVKCHQIQFNHIISYLSLFLGTSQCPPFLCPIRCSSPRFHWVRIGVQRPTLRWLSLSQKWGKPAGGCLLKSEFTSNNRDFIKHKRRVHCTVMAIYQL